MNPFDRTGIRRSAAVQKFVSKSNVTQDSSSDNCHTAQTFINSSPPDRRPRTQEAAKPYFAPIGAQSPFPHVKYEIVKVLYFFSILSLQNTAKARQNW
ncbi:MAG: hypothetical protein NC254_03520 [bacterium]|nr:hypothetical protein [bacterium]